MGLCEYCGTQAGFMRRSHRACVELFEHGIRKIETVVAKSPLSLADAVARIQELAQVHGVAVEHLTTALEEAWAGYVSTRMQERGLSATEEARLDALIGAFGLNNLKVERHRIWSSVLRRRQIAASEIIEGLVHKGLQLAAAAPADSAASESGLAQMEADITSSRAGCQHPGTGTGGACCPMHGGSTGTDARRRSPFTFGGAGCGRSLGNV